ncbi:hypothetical protein ABIE67_009661 [Streptomyces sp. V4I8]|uniref:hypothetical protein n=1 Tax=Streptomyces sp. V4I8 TaxID=3156469 RepID=UPI003511BD23
MTVRRVESRLPPGLSAGDLGQASGEVLGPSGERFVLVSYLESPVPEQTRLDYVLFALPPAGSNENLWLDYVEIDEYRWEVTSPTDPQFAPILSVGDTGCFWWEGQRPSHQYVITVTPRLKGAILATVQLTQGTREREPRLEAKLARKRKDPGEPDSQRELINDFGDFVRTAAAATGTNGIPARALAAILYMELNARPKDGTRRADMYRRRSRINRTPTWVEWTSAEVRQHFNQSQKLVHLATDFYPLTEIRCIEIALGGDMFDDTVGPRVTLFGGKTLGVGQIGLSTAAMVIGAAPWVEGTPGKLSEAHGKVDQNWRVIPLLAKVGIFNRLRFPKANITLTAQLLDRLKNRANRYPTTGAAAFWQDEFAVSLLATEYNHGPTNSALADARLPPGRDENWRRAIRFVKPSYPIYPELFFP